ncbi:MAG: LPS-assembly protein LptD [Magnetococcales bacterium]|nr:LPS-assembly protein LptD [Magnetococcales bacterium]
MEIMKLRVAAATRRAGSRCGRRLATLSALVALSMYSSPAWSEGKLPVDIEADDFVHDRETGVVSVKGKVRIDQGEELQLRADEASYDTRTGRIEAVGGIRLVRKGDVFTSERVSLDVQRRSGTLSRVGIDLKGPGRRATAESVELFDANRAELKGATYTNCDCEGEPPWYLRASTLELDSEANSVTAKGASLHFYGVPLAYSPWWRHPLRPERQSGFLMPRIEVSGGNGLELDVPYYWNIAPERDATLTLHPTTRRGVMGKMEYRYLGKGSRGQFRTHDIYDTVREEYRGLTLLEHRQNLGPWGAEARVAASRTRDFVNDFNQDLVDQGNRNLESMVVFDRNWLRDEGATTLETGARWYQNLDATSDIHTTQQLPYALMTDSRPFVGGWQLETELGADHFYQMGNDTALRLNLAPELVYERPLGVGRFSSTLGARQTGYWLGGHPVQEGNPDESFEQSTGGLVAGRLDLKLARGYRGPGGGSGHEWRHTLEPSVQYVVNAATDQSSLPDFDATLRDFTTTNLFAHNLYSGTDRISSAQWLAYGITSRLTGQVGDDGGIRELATVTIGQRWAPEGNREYQGEHASSDAVAGLNLSLTDRWSLSSDLRYDPHDSLLRAINSGVAFVPGESHFLESLTLGHHRTKPDPAMRSLLESNEPVDDLALGSRMRFRERWVWKQESRYSLEFEAVKSWETGLTFEESCWSLSLVGGRRLAADTLEHGGGFIGLFLNLQGLGDYGIKS